MIYTVKQILETFKDKDPSEVIHLWYREKSDFDGDEYSGEGFELDENEWKRLADFRCKIEETIDEVMRDVIEDETQRADYPESFFD